MVFQTMKHRTLRQFCWSSPMKNAAEPRDKRPPLYTLAQIAPMLEVKSAYALCGYMAKHPENRPLPRRPRSGQTPPMYALKDIMPWWDSIKEKVT